jgi:hypothetical protein
MAAERLRELGRLAVPDALGDAAHRERRRAEQARGLVHADGMQVAAKRRLAALLEHPLQLTPRGEQSASDLIEVERPAMVLEDERGRVLPELLAAGDSGLALWHVGVTPPPMRRDHRERYE